MVRDTIHQLLDYYKESSNNVTIFWLTLCLFRCSMFLALIIAKLLWLNVADISVIDGFISSAEKK